MPGRIVAIDPGSKRVGIAMADPLGLFAQPVGTYNPREAIQQLVRLDAADGIQTLVIGWPLTEEGARGPATDRVDAYIHRIQEALPAVAVERWDERYTSEEAKDRLRTAGRRRGRTALAAKERVDVMAAAIILQEYLDTQSSGDQSP